MSQALQKPGRVSLPGIRMPLEQEHTARFLALPQMVCETLSQHFSPVGPTPASASMAGSGKQTCSY